MAEQITDRHRMTVLEQGSSWMIVNIQDLEGDEAGTDLYVAIGLEGLNKSPMPREEKAKLATMGETSAEHHDRVYIVAKDIVDSYWQDGTIPERYLSFAGSTCDTYTGRVAESFAPALPPFVGSRPMSEVSPSGTLDGEIRLEVGIEADLDVVVEYEVGQTLCIPSSVAVSYVDIDAALRLVDGSLAMEVAATRSWSKTYERQIANPRLWVLTFPIGVIPVVINFKLPTHIGIDLSTSAVARTEIEVPWSGDFGFHYRCDASGCGGSSSHAFSFQNPLNNAQASVEVDLSAKPYLDSRVRANLYSDSVFYADVGLRAGIQNRLWGYFGNDCGDADGDGVNELVQGAIFDSYFDLQLPYS
ncbi:MAG: hypothetical protein MI919_12770, partial [Holophagales bacterium]|nr:hypothetical protein [Holophagales bacterium]